MANIYQNLHDAVQQAFRSFSVVRDTNTYSYGVKFDSDDDFFTGGAAKKSYLVYIGGTRPAASPATGDSNDAMLRMDFSNYAVNDTNFIMRGINMDVQNRSSGILNLLEGAKFTARQRNDAGAITALRGVYVNSQVNVGSGLIGTSCEGIFVEQQLEANMPATSFGVRVLNRTDGSYTLPTAGFAVRNNGTSGCLGYKFGLDLYDSNADTCSDAEIRMNDEVCIITKAGVPGATDGDGVAGPGSICVDTTNKKLYVNGGTKATPDWKLVTSA